MTTRYATSSLENNELMQMSETELIQWAANLSPEEIERAVLHMWDQLQQVSSYVETMIEANRGMLEGIATQY
jgi:hypothetical protein